MLSVNHLGMLVVMMGMVGLVGCQSDFEADTRSFPTVGSVERLDPALDKLIPAGAEIEVLAKGFDWAEGPVWVETGAKRGYLLFSDIPPNSIYKWTPGESVSLFMRPSGYTGTKTRGGEPGSNGLTLDAKGRLVACEHGDRRVSRLVSLDEPNGAKVTLAGEYNGKRFNSPNDLVYHKNGDLYFTDPPYGLPKNVNDPGKELPFQGVYRLSKDGTVTLLTDKMERPNGIAFSPDYKTLYVANSHGPRMIWMAYGVKDDGTLDEGRVFFDATELRKKTGRRGAPDGLKVDQDGNLFATGPGGVLVFSPEGKHLGTILTGQATANCAFGDDGKTLYMTADMLLLKIRLNTRGMGF